jgi:hypothetical protein
VLGQDRVGYGIAGRVCAAMQRVGMSLAGRTSNPGRALCRRADVRLIVPGVQREPTTASSRRRWWPRMIRERGTRYREQRDLPAV